LMLLGKNYDSAF